MGLDLHPGIRRQQVPPGRFSLRQSGLGVGFGVEHRCRLLAST